ncbi:type II secretion system protein [Photobacterium phosphoreum]|uniref:prepilin-type N-terminal cleavage/methylation domain-containing protein n=1 Tax=Photobacterium phosphoreum TaxID=659 RepID=UPI000D16BFC5|nr:type II secretion system protein [Photobacterium phosphoreum]PSW30792.1 type II secretion system protein [Photobacterium phosphoreum]
MKPFNKQSGFGLVEIMMGLTILSLVMSAYIPWKNNQEKKQHGIDYAHYITRVISGIQQYQYWKINENPNINSKDAFPFAIKSLMDNNGQWWPKCSDAEYKNKMCLLPDIVPWNGNALISYKRVNEQIYPNTPHPAYAELSIPLGLIPKNERAYWRNPLIQLAHSKEDKNGNIIIQIYDPMISLFYKKAEKQFLKKDGSTPLEGDWDVGNKSIFNAKKYSVKTQDGNQLRIDAGTVREFLAKNDTKIYKNSWSCPQGLRKVIHVGLHAPMAPNSTVEYVGIASFNPYYLDYGSYYLLKLDYNAKIKSTGKWQKMTSGFLNVRLNCSQ